jgi:hypothetical protein
VSADFTAVNFNCRDPGCFHSMLVSFVCGVWWWTHVSSPVTMHSRNLWPQTVYCCSSERAQVISCTLWFFDGAWPIMYMPCGIQTPKWSWQHFHGTDSSFVIFHWSLFFYFWELHFSHIFLSGVLAVVHLPLLLQLSVLIHQVIKCAQHFVAFFRCITFFS